MTKKDFKPIMFEVKTLEAASLLFGHPRRYRYANYWQWYPDVNGVKTLRSCSKTIRFRNGVAINDPNTVITRQLPNPAPNEPDRFEVIK